MDFVIYSIGDSYYLERCLNAIAAICQTSDFVRACGVAALVGILIVAFGTILKGSQELPIINFLYGVLFFFISFYPSVNVAIYDVYSQQVRKVDNIPLGPAITGSFLSQIGYGLTEMFETTFITLDTSATITGAGAGAGSKFGNSLYMLNSLIRIGAGGEASKAFNKITDLDLSRTLEDYTRYCTFRAVQLTPKYGGKNLEDIKDMSATQALRFDSDMYYTSVTMNGESHDYTCREAWNIINDKYQDFMSTPTGNEAVTKLINQVTGAVNESEPGARWVAASQISIADLYMHPLEALRLNTTDAQEFMMGTVLTNIYSEGMARGYADYHDYNSATMIRQAINQRNMQWAAEQTMFFDTLRPMLSWIEGFVYCITPFVALILLLGYFGLKLYFKYLQMLIWIQLWLPCVAIANFFIMVGAENALLDLSLAAPTGQAISSMSSINRIAEIAQTWIATGGMFCSAIPVISFILVSGSSYALTQLTNRMGGADHINEKIASPDIVNPAAAMSMASYYSANSLSSLRSGTSSLIPTVTMQGNYSGVVAQQRQHAMTLSNQFSTQLNKALNESGGWSRATGENGMFSQAYNNASSEVKSFVKQVQDAYKEATGRTISDAEGLSLAWSLSTGAGLNASLGLGGGKVDAGQEPDGGQGKLGISGNVGAKGTATGTETHNLMDKFDKSKEAQNLKSQAKDLSSQLTDTISSAYSKSVNNGETYGINQSTAQSISDVGTSARSAMDSWQRAQSKQDSLTAGRTFKMDVLSAWVKEQGNADAVANAFNNLMRSSNTTDTEKQSLSRLQEAAYNRYLNIVGYSAAMADIASKMEIMATMQSGTDDITQFEAKSTLLDIIDNNGFTTTNINQPINKTTNATGADAGLVQNVNSSKVMDTAKQNTNTNIPDFVASGKAAVDGANIVSNQKVNSAYTNEQLKQAFEENRKLAQAYHHIDTSGPIDSGNNNRANSSRLNKFRSSEEIKKYQELEAWTVADALSLTDKAFNWSGLQNNWQSTQEGKMLYEYARYSLASQNMESSLATEAGFNLAVPVNKATLNEINRRKEEAWSNISNNANIVSFMGGKEKLADLQGALDMYGSGGNSQVASMLEGVSQYAQYEKKFINN